MRPESSISLFWIGLIVDTALKHKSLGHNSSALFSFEVLMKEETAVCWPRKPIYLAVARQQCYLHLPTSTYCTMFFCMYQAPASPRLHAQVRAVVSSTKILLPR